MAYRPPKKQPQFADLKGILSQSKQTDNALYQTVQILIERLTQFQGITVDRLDQLDDELDEIGVPEPVDANNSQPVPLLLSKKPVSVE